jgi:LacI family transcriptional regulator
MTARRPTLHDVAAEAGVSIKTASRVVNDVPTVDAGIAARVRAAIAHLGYRPNQLAATLKSGGATRTIGLVVKDISNEFYAAIALGVAGVARARSTQVIMAASDEDIDADDEVALVSDLIRRRVDGLVVVPRGGDYARLAAEVALGTPVVVLDRPADGLDADTVVLDNAGGARAAVAQLIADGHRRIGVLLHQPALAPIRDRRAGVLEALDEAGVTLDPSLLAVDILDPEGARRAAGRMLELPDPPTAFFCANNRLTEGAVRAVLEHRAPTVVAGFDDLRVGDLLPVPLLLVAYDARAYGRAAAELLFERIDGETAGPRHVTFPTRLIRAGMPSA